MIKKIWLFICYIFDKLIRLFKKNKIEIKESSKIKENKETFVKSVVDITSSFIGDISSCSKNDINKIEKDIEQIINNIDNSTKEEIKKEIKKVLPKLEKVKKEIISKPILNKVDANKKENRLEKINNLEKTIKVLESIYPITKKKEKSKNKTDLKINDSFKSKSKINEDVIKNDKEETKLDYYKTYIKESNNVLKEGSKLLKEIEYDLTLNKNNLDNNKFKIDELKSKIIQIKKNYYDFINSDYIYIIEKDFNIKQIDENKLVCNPSKIDFYLNKCNVILQTIEYKRYHKEEIYEEKKAFSPKKPVLEEQPRVEIPKIILEIEQANNIIKKDIKDQKKELKKINERLDTFSNHEYNVRKLGVFTNFLSNTFKFGISLLPFKLFKNKTLGILTSGFILNNRIRSMRKIINPNININYIEFNRRIKNQLDIINNYNTVCIDSLYQVTSLKDEFIRYYGYNLEDEEIKNTYKKLILLEEQITKQQQNLLNAKVKLNNKIKIKKIKR